MVIRRRMFCYLFYKKFVCLFFFLFFLISRALCENVNAVSTVPAKSSPASTVNSFELFKPENINNVAKPDENSGEEKENISVKNVTSPFLFAADGLMFAVAEVNNTNKSETKIDLMAKYISTTEGEWGDNAIKTNSNDKWKSQLVTKNNKGIKFGFAAKGAAVTDDKKKIYLLAVNNTSPAASESESSDNNNLRLLWIVCDISNGVTDGNEKKITWSTQEVESKKVVDELKKTFSKDPTKITLSAGGSAFLTKDKTIVFVLQISGGDDNGKNVIAVTQIKDAQPTNDKAELELLHNETLENCYPYVVYWNEKLMMILNNCKQDEGFPSVKEFNFDTKKWEGSKEPILQLWGFLNDKRDFATARIGNNNKSVLLFTQHKSNSGFQNKKDVHLWVTDGDHLSDVGTVAANIDGGGDYYYYGSILHTNDELFVLQQKYNEGGSVVKDTFELTRLKEQLGKINNLLEVWKKADETVSKICGDKSGGSSKKLCATQLSTDGLVGFLSGGVDSNNNKEWKDEYRYADATVSGGGVRSAAGGFTFNEKGAGANWPVGKKAEDQPYNFTDPGFTLVATVKIEKQQNKNDNSLLGVMFGEDGEKGVGLWCTKDNKWGITGVDDIAKISSTEKGCQEDNEYQVAFVLEANNLQVYVDWEELKGLSQKIMKSEKTHNITHFYFGADNNNKQSDIKSHVTVRNVLLYNRPFTKDEVGELKIPKEIKPSEPANGSRGGNEPPKDKGGDGGSPSRPSRTEKVQENSTSQPENSTVRGDYVGVFVCFVMLAHALCFL